MVTGSWVTVIDGPGGGVLRIDDLHKSFGEVAALDGCSLTVQPGQMLGLLGPNGAGNTTAMRSIFGLIRPDGGTITWQGRPIDQATRRCFGYMPEERGLYPKLPVRWQLVYLGRLHGMEADAARRAADGWLDRFSLLDRAESRLAELSHGNQQRIQLIAALIHDPGLVVLDEPFTGLDPIGAESMADILRDLTEGDSAVVFSSHQLDVVEDLCRDVAIIHEGRVVLEGRVEELRAASNDRYVEFTGGDRTWIDALPGAEIVELSEDRTRVRLTGSVDLDKVAALVAGTGVTRFIFEPPPLSEIFKRAVES